MNEKYAAVLRPPFRSRVPAYTHIHRNADGNARRLRELNQMALAKKRSDTNTEELRG